MDLSNDTGKAEAGDTITLRKVIKLPAAKLAKAVVTADNEYQLYINNKLIGSDADLLSAKTSSITGNLRAGANTILIVVKNGGSGPNPAAAYFEARLHLADGKEETIISDSSWRWTRSVEHQGCLRYRSQ